MARPTSIGGNWSGSWFIWFGLFLVVCCVVSLVFLGLVG